MSVYNKLFERYQEEKEKEAWRLSKLEIPEEKPFYTDSFESLNVLYALYEMYKNSDFEKARYHFYQAARVAEYELKRHSLIETTIPRIGYAMFSDDHAIIDRYCQMKTSMGDKWVGTIYIRSIQSVLLGDNDQLEFWMKKYEDIFAKKKDMTWQGCLEVLQGIKNSDKAQAELGINNLLKTHKRRPGLGYIDPYFSIVGSTMAKLAWITGLEVFVDNILIPMDLLPVRPLPKYEDAYDFLKE